MRILFCLVVLIPTFTLTTLQAQEYGVYGQYGLLLHRADFRAFPGVPNCCPAFENNSGKMLGAGLLYDYYFNDKSVLSLRGGFFSYEAELLRTENTTGAGNVPVRFEHRIDATLSDIALQPTYKHLIGERLWLHGGLHIGSILSSNFSQVEQITTPLDAVFETGSSTRNEVNDQEIPEIAALRTAISLGISFDLPLNRLGSTVLAPEAGFTYGIGNLVGETDWTMNSINLGVSLRFNAGRGKQRPPVFDDNADRDDTKPEADALARQRPNENEEARADQQVKPEPAPKTQSLTAEVSAKGIDADGSISDIVTMKIEEFETFRAHPLLPYIFFDEDSDVLRDRYRRLNQAQKDNFGVRQFSADSTLEVYYNLLNIVGKRMRDQPTAKLELTGTNSNENLEQADLALSDRRANAVKNYLVREWGIDADRISTIARNLPRKSSNVETAEGLRENRRVELKSDDPSILALVEIEDTLRRSNPPAIRFTNNVTSSDGVKRWRLQTLQNGKLLKQLEGEGAPPESIDWNLEAEQKTMPTFDSPLEYELVVTGQGETELKERAGGKIDLNLLTVSEKRRDRIDDKYVTEFNLILFDFNSAELQDRNRAVIAKLDEWIEPNSVVKIIGYTDNTGTPAINQKLSEDRAEAVGKAIGHKAVELSGVGENNSLYPFDSEEGRMYARTVQVIIETPIKHRR